jgi:hypothetical protein
MPASVVTTDELPALVDRLVTERLEELRPDTVTWKTADVIHQLGGVQRDRFDTIIAKHWDELVEIGAVTQGKLGAKIPKKYRASVMRPWIDEHAEEFGTGVVK